MKKKKPQKKVTGRKHKMDREMNTPRGGAGPAKIYYGTPAF